MKLWSPPERGRSRFKKFRFRRTRTYRIEAAPDGPGWVRVRLLRLSAAGERSLLTGAATGPDCWLTERDVYLAGPDALSLVLSWSRDGAETGLVRGVLCGAEVLALCDRASQYFLEKGVALPELDM